MKILAIESASKTASVALMDDDKLIAEMTLNGKLNHSETLLPMIDNICGVAGIEVKDVELIAVSKGPGSYTGLRIGVSLAKGIARVSGASIVGVSTLDSLAYAQTRTGLICSMLDARRTHAYCVAYHRDENSLSEAIAPELRDVADFVSMVTDMIIESGELPIFIGDGTINHRELLEKALKEQGIACYLLGDDRDNTPFAFSLGLCALEKYKQGEKSDYRHFVPDYFRASQAKRMMTNAKNSPKSDKDK